MKLLLSWAKRCWLIHSLQLSLCCLEPCAQTLLHYLPSSCELLYLQPAYLQSNTEQDRGPGLCPKEGDICHCLGKWLLQARTDSDCSRAPGVGTPCPIQPQGFRLDVRMEFVIQRAVSPVIVAWSYGAPSLEVPQMGPWAA